MVLNGDFETGSFDSWSVLGNTEVDSGSASIDNGSGSPTDNVVENFLGLASGSLDGLTTTGNATTGSAIESSAFEATAGQILSFDWEFFTNEGIGSFYNDFSFFSIDSLSDSAAADAYLLADTNGLFGPQTSTFNFDADGYYQVGFGVMDQVDTVVDSELLLDNVHILNTNFETGDFSDWDVFGNTDIETNDGTTIPAEGDYQAILSSAFGAVSDANLETDLGLNAGALDNLGNGNATEGSAIQLTPIDVEAGDVLSFEWDFLTGESSSFYNDFAFISIVGDDGSTLFIDTLDSVALGATSGFETFDYTFGTSGTFNVALGVMDEQDTAVASTLQVDNLLLL